MKKLHRGSISAPSWLVNWLIGKLFSQLASYEISFAVRERLRVESACN
jgi:hypothetical protein